MRAWLARQRSLAELAQRVQEARLEAESARRERDALFAELSGALGPASIARPIARSHAGRL